MNIKKLSDTLHYLNIKELKDLCTKYNLPTNIPAPLLKKPCLIQAIINYVQTGKVTLFKNLLPLISRTKVKLQELDPQTKILFGTYKNDLKTRLFMQKLIGSHFHFTVYGHDWIKERWMEGNPPTYQEFANFWQEQYLYRKSHNNSPLKQEWAYLNFLRMYTQQHPNVSKHEKLIAWEKIRKQKVKEAYEMLDDFYVIYMYNQ